MDIYKQILDIWTDHCNGLWWEDDGKVTVSFPSETWEYDCIEDAVREALYNIREYLKEV